eukprot:2669633-Pyramimonas_sp.AAC.1
MAVMVDLEKHWQPSLQRGLQPYMRQGSRTGARTTSLCNHLFPLQPDSQPGFSQPSSRSSVSRVGLDRVESSGAWGGSGEG